MRNFYVLTTALDYIESHITAEFTLEELAGACATSLSSLHRLFRYAFGWSVKSYIQRRRNSLACADLLNTRMSVLDIAMKYQYGSAEGFTRAFFRLRGMTPSDYRKKCGFANLYPKIRLDMGGEDMRKFDISELYDVLRELGGSYVLCADIVGLRPINEKYGYAAGDLALAKTAERLQGYLSEEMFMFRVGRDEFALVTGCYEESRAKALAEEILSENGKAFDAGEHRIPLSVRIGILRIPDAGFSFHEVFMNIQTAIERVRASGSRPR